MLDEILKQEAGDGTKPNFIDIEISLDLKNYSQNLSTPSLKVETDVQSFLSELINTSPRVTLINDPFLISDLSSPATCLNQVLEVRMSYNMTIKSYMSSTCFLPSYIYIYISHTDKKYFFSFCSYRKRKMPTPTEKSIIALTFYLIPNLKIWTVIRKLH
jgi:hypothetical protein